MAGKRIAQPDLEYDFDFGMDYAPKKKKKKSHGGAIAFAIIAALLAGAAAALGIYANGYDRVFPGVTLGEESLGGRTREELEAYLSSDGLLSGQVSVTADGEDLGRHTQRELGAYIDSGKLADAAWSVGREEGALGWFKNAWTMLTGTLGKNAGSDIEVYYDDSVLQAEVAKMAASFDRAPVDSTYSLSREGIYATRASDGRKLDQPGLILSIVALEGGSGDVEAEWDSVPGKSLDMDELALELNAEPSNARYDIEQGKVVDGMVGVSLDPQAARFALDAAAPGETIQLPAQVIYPEMTAQEMEAVLFRDVLGTASTDVGGTRVRRNNVKLAGECINGLILNDGDIFDYNKVVGKRTTERGFGAAPAYVNGETVETVGGGICQVSSTVYYATLLANLETVERYAHRYAPSYIEWGMDATVSWGGPEYRFKNNTGYPIRLDVTYANDKITVTIMGTKTDDTYVKMTHKTLKDIPYETEYVETEALAWGTRQQKQSPYTGHNVISYKSIYDGNGNLISQTEEATSNYKSRNEIILVGTAGKPAAGGTTIPDSGGDTSGGGETADEPTLPTEEAGPVLPDDGSPGLSIFN